MLCARSDLLSCLVTSYRSFKPCYSQYKILGMNLEELRAHISKYRQTAKMIAEHHKTPREKERRTSVSQTREEEMYKKSLLLSLR